MKTPLLLLTLLMSFAGSAHATSTYIITIDTSALVGNAAGPFQLDFQFTDGSGSNDGNNTVMFSNFVFGTGSPTGSPSTAGGVSGDLASGFSLTDNAFLSEFTQTFTSGSVLSFTLSFTANLDLGGVPDELSFAILDSTGAAIPTLGTFDTLLLMDIDSGAPTLQAYGSDTSRGTVATGNPINLPAPAVSETPEPSSVWLFGSGLALFGIRRFRS